jgi:PAB-dependent poly(A)-specific ribonuclease subunit 3
MPPSQPDFGRKLNGESPSFTPANLQNLHSAKKTTTLPVQAASAAPFTPRASGAAVPATQQEPEQPAFNPAAIREFTPQYDMTSNIATNGAPPEHMHFDPFSAMAPVGHAIPPQYNPYAEDPSGLAGHNGAFFPAQNPFGSDIQPLQYHLYYPTAPRRQDLLSYQKVTQDFFVPEKLREELHRKSEAWRQVLSSGLPQLDNYHSLVALDTSHRKMTGLFGYTSWVYKGTSSKTGHVYCLRRLEGYRLTNEDAIRSVKAWRRVFNANVVSVWDAFTTRAFGDSSLIFVMDYHPLSKTLAEFHHLQAPSYAAQQPHNYRMPMKPIVPEPTLWNYISQIANALKGIHDCNLAARCIDATKIILTGKQRIRLNACSILDVVNFDARRPVADLQQEDFISFGRLILHLATDTPITPYTNLQAPMDALARLYSPELRDTVFWLLSPPQPPATTKTIDDFVRGIAPNVMSALNSSFLANDSLTDVVTRELENGRAARIAMKLATITERNDHEGDRAWSETGERYILKLFRDYAFHQVDAQGNPVLDIGHMLRCLNKLDAGTEEQVCLTSRDELASFVISYKELKKHVVNAFGELLKGNSSANARPGRRNP